MNTQENCTYGYQTVAGTLDSYPVVNSSSCTSIGTSTNSTSSPFYTQDNGNITFGIGIIILFQIIICIVIILKRT